MNMKRWIGAGILAATLMVTGCAGNGYYGRNYRYDQNYRYRNSHDRNYRDRNYHNNDRRHRESDQDRRDDRNNWR
jgi:hypothetical protein